MTKEFFKNQYLEKYCVARGLAAKSILTYDEGIKEYFKFLDDLKKNLEFKTITTTVICEFIEYLSKYRNNSQSTIIKKITVIRSFYQALVALELIEPKEDPCHNLPRMKKAQEKVGDILSISEIEKLSNAPNTETILGLRDRVILLLLCTTGIRASECATIKEKDVDLPNRMVRVLGKGNRERVVMINETTAKAIENYIKFRGNQARDQDFFKVRTGKGINRKRIFERVKYYLQKARIFKKISPHRLRHSFATKMIQDGVNIATLKELLGHRNIQSTMRYIQTTGEELRKAIAKLNIDETFERIVSALPFEKLKFQRP